MKIFSAKNKISGFNLVELLVIIGIIAVLAAMLLPPVSGKWKAQQINCANNLKMLDQSFVASFHDHNRRLPMQVPLKDGGTMDLIPSGSAVVHFLALTNYGIEPKRLICPSDTRWIYDKPISELTDTNISYFVGVDAKINDPKSIFIGDRNLEVNGTPTKSGLLELAPKTLVGWTKELHYSKSSSTAYGNILFADGHVEFLKSKALNSAFQSGTNRLAIP